MTMKVRKVSSPHLIVRFNPIQALCPWLRATFSLRDLFQRHYISTMLFTKAAILGLAALAAAHPGHEEAEHRHAIAARANTQANKRALEGCAAKLESRGVTARAIERRKATMARHREDKRIPVDSQLPMYLRSRTCFSVLTYVMLTQLLGTNSPIQPRQQLQQAKHHRRPAD